MGIEVRRGGFSRCKVAGSFATFVLLAASASVRSGSPDVTPSFKNDIVPILNANCVFCHVTGAENGGLNLGRRIAYQNLVSAPSTESALMRVAPGNPDKSYLMNKLTGTQLKVGGTGEAMPKVDPPKLLDPAEVELIRNWILAGAKDN